MGRGDDGGDGERGENDGEEGEETTESEDDDDEVGAAADAVFGDETDDGDEDEDSAVFVKDFSETLFLLYLFDAFSCSIFCAFCRFGFARMLT